MEEPWDAQEATCTWGPFTFSIKSFTLASSSGQDIDITSMTSAIEEDKENTGRFFVAQEYDSCFSSKGGGEFSIEFLLSSGLSGNPMDLVGYARDLSIKAGKFGPGAEEYRFRWEQRAILSDLRISAATGEFLSGSATFRLSG